MIRHIAGIAAITLAALVCCANAATDNDPVLRFLEPRVKNDPQDFIAWNKLCAHYLKLLRITGDNEFLAKAAHAAEQSLKAVAVEHNTGGLMQSASVELASHRF